MTNTMDLDDLNPCPAVSRFADTCIRTSVVFPNEVWELILQNLDHKKDKSTINALRLLHRHLNRLLRPLVYKEVRDTIRQKGSYDGGLQQSTWDIVNNLSLAPLVRTLDFQVWDFLAQDNRGVNMPSKPGSPSYDQYCLAIDATSFPVDLRQAVLNRIWEESPMAHLSLLLGLCHRVELLNLPCGYEAVNRTLKRVISYAVDSISYDSDDMLNATGMLSSLKSLSIGFCKYSCYMTSLKDMLPFLSLPQLTSLSVLRLADNGDLGDHTVLPRPTCIIPIGSRSLQLRLDECHLSPQGLGYLLAAWRGPISLCIRWRRWNQDMPLSEVGDALRDHGRGLISLVLDTTILWPGDRLVPGHIGDLSILNSLERLALPLHTFRNPIQQNDDTSSSASSTIISSPPFELASILPGTLKQLYILGFGITTGSTSEEEVVNGHDNDNNNDDSQPSPATQGVSIGFNNDLNSVFNSLVTEPQLPQLKQVVEVPWEKYTTEEWYGQEERHYVDYQHLNRIGEPGLGFDNFRNS